MELLTTIPVTLSLPPPSLLFPSVSVTRQEPYAPAPMLSLVQVCVRMERGRRGGGLQRSS